MSTKSTTPPRTRPQVSLDERLGGATVHEPSISKKLQRLFPDDTLQHNDTSYIIRGILGEGGEGAALLLEDQLGNLAVGKVVQTTENFLPLSSQHRDIYREITALRILDHEDIPKEHGILQAPENHIVAIRDYVPGKSLQEIVDTNGPITAGQAIGFMRDILPVLSYIHSVVPDEEEEPIKHRDITPNNIIIGPDGKARLTDFGAATIRDKTTLATNIGTVGYKPPEQSLGRAVPSSDLYALSASLITALTGKSPLEVGLLDSQMPGAKPFILNETASAQLKRVLERGVLSELTPRYKGAIDMLQGLENSVSTGFAYTRDEWLHAKADELCNGPLVFGKKARIGKLLGIMPRKVQLIHGNDTRDARKYLDSVLLSENKEGKINLGNQRNNLHGSIRFLLGEDEPIIVAHNVDSFSLWFEISTSFGLSLKSGKNIQPDYITTRNQLQSIIDGNGQDQIYYSSGSRTVLREIRKRLPLTYAALEAMLPEVSYKDQIVSAASHLIVNQRYSKDARPYAIAERVANVFGKRRAKSKFLPSPEYSKYEMRRKLDEAGIHVSVGTLTESKLVVDRDNFGNVSYFSFEDVAKRERVLPKQGKHWYRWKHNEHFRFVYKTGREE